MVSQAHIARASGLSRQTVSFALNEGLRDRLKPETRQRVLDAAERLGYVPHNAARRLVRARSRTPSRQLEQVGFIYVAPPSEQLDDVCFVMMRGAEHELSKLHASLLFVRAGEPGEWEKVERLTQAGGVDGWLIYGPATDDMLHRLESGRLPFVIIGEHRSTRPVSVANIDSLAVGRFGVEYLAALGHRRVAYMSSPRRFEYQRQVLAGFRAAAAELPLDQDERLIAPTAWSSSGAQQLFDWLLSHDPVPTAVFMPDFGIAQTLHPMMKQSPLAALRGMSVLASGYEKPADVGQDFTSIDLRLGEVGRAGAALLRRIVTEQLQGPQSVTIPPGLFEGRSVFPLPPSVATADAAATQ